MVKKTFKGGIHPSHNKELTEELKTIQAVLPEKVVIAMQQHIGAPCKPLVKVGDTVRAGEKIGDSEAFVSAPVYSSVSGKVTAIGDRYVPLGARVECVEIEVDSSADNSIAVIEGFKKVSGKTGDLSGEEILALIREAGIVGMGGAAFPTHVKLSPPKGKRIDTVILNGAECEPYLTADHRVMLEEPDNVVYGLKLVMKVLKATRGFIGIEDNKPDCIAAIEAAAKSDERISVFTLPVKYPQGAEKMLIDVITGKEVPSGGLPLDVGVVIQNVGTSAAIARAVREGIPLVERVVTVTGNGIVKPANLMVKIGTAFNDIIKQCLGLTGDAAKIISGGPMMGVAQATADVPVMKGTSGILVLTDKEVSLADPGPCIRCGRCIVGCPMKLMPNFLGIYGEQKKYEEAEPYHALDCIECGCCAYICPAGRPLTQWIRAAKAEITARKRKES